MITNFFSTKYFGCVVKGINTTKDEHKKLWTAIGNGWHRIIENNNVKEIHLWVSDAEAKGDLLWLNLGTFSGEIVSFQGTREIYCNGKKIKAEKFSFPKLQDYKAIIAEYEKKPYEPVTELSSEDVKKLQDKEHERVTAEAEVNHGKYFESKRVVWSL